ncbi:hypothetical protein NQZ70_07781 [Sorangium sp. Soce836]|nr:hypothetical protein NQZ70_07781 [Sorangium sp. Soce836]
MKLAATEIRLNRDLPTTALEKKGQVAHVF